MGTRPVRRTSRGTTCRGQLEEGGRSTEASRTSPRRPLSAMDVDGLLPPNGHANRMRSSLAESEHGGLGPNGSHGTVQGHRAVATSTHGKLCLSNDGPRQKSTLSIVTLDRWTIDRRCASKPRQETEHPVRGDGTISALAYSVHYDALRLKKMTACRVVDDGLDLHSKALRAAWWWVGPTVEGLAQSI